MPIVNGTYVGQVQGRATAPDLFAALEAGRQQKQTDAVNLANAFEKEWQNYENWLLSTMTTPEGAAGAAERYRAGLELRNKATGNTLSPDDLDALTAQWLQMQEGRRTFASAPGKAAPAAPPPTAPTTYAAKLDTKRPPISGPKFQAPVTASPAQGVDAVSGAAPTSPTGASSPALENAVGTLSINKSIDPRTAAARFDVCDASGNVLVSFPTRGAAENYIASQTHSIKSTTPSLTVRRVFDYSSAQERFDVVDSQGTVVQSFPTKPAAEAFIKQPRYAGLGVAPGVPGGFDATLGDRVDPVTGRPRSELVVDLQQAQANPTAAVQTALAQGVPPGAPVVQGAAGSPGALAISPVPPSLQAGAPAEGGPAPAPGAPASKPPYPTYEEPKSPKMQAIVAEAAVKSRAAGASVGALLRQMQEIRDSGDTKKGPQRLVESKIVKDLGMIRTSSARVAALPEFKAFMKGVNAEAMEAFKNATPEDFAAIGMKDVADIKLQRDNLAFEWKQRWAEAALRASAEAGSASAQTIVTNYDVAESVIKTYTPFAEALLKQGKSMDQVLLQLPALAKANEVALLATGGKIEIYSKGTIFNGGVSKRPATPAELAQVPNPQETFAVTKSSTRGVQRAAASAPTGQAPAAEADAFLKSLSSSFK